MSKTLETPPDLSQLARDPEPAPFEVRGRPGIHIVVSVVAGGTALAYLWRAIDGGSPILWAMVALLVGVSVLHLLGRREAALPRLVADEHGVRVRQRAQWIGLPWSDLERVEVAALHGPLGPTSVRLLTGDDDPIVVRCGASSRLSADDIVLALRALSGNQTQICRGLAPSEYALPGADLEEHDEDDPVEDDGTAVDETGSGRAVRAQVTRTDPGVVGLIPLQPESGVETEEAGAAEPDDAEPEPGDDAEAEPVIGRAPTIRAEVDASIGPLLSAARFRSRLSVDELGERTRIRPHVIESIENDDFGPCGGDFYARGHLRSLCRVLGVDPDPILDAFDRRYARAPIEAREVFEAELATGPRPSFRSIGRASNWIALLVVVMLLAIVWAVAKVVTDGGETESPAPAPPPVSTAPDNDRMADLGAPTVNELTLRAIGNGTRVMVKNADGKQVWDGRPRRGESHDVAVAGPATVIAADGGAVRMRLNGDARGRLGKPGEPTRLTVGHR
jgi:cytoskeleton protein RodZ